MIIKIIMKAYEEWTTENKRFEDLAALATISYKKIETIIVSLESETLRVPANQLSQNPIKLRCITADYQKMHDKVIEFAGFMV
jgi:hypothetical protein